MKDQELVDVLDETWSSTRAVCAQLDDAEWMTPTDCPGWTVKDVLAHVIGIEEMSMGHEAPIVEVPDLEHVAGEIGRINEVWVESMRPLSGADVADRFTMVTEARLAGLRSLDGEGFGGDSWTPLGPGTVRDLLPFRIFDSWVHEQDIRLAVGRPGALDGLAAAEALRRCVDSMGYAVGKLAGAPDGSVVVFDLTEPMATCFAVGVEDGRGSRLDVVPNDPTVTISTTGETFVRLCCGRTTPDRVEVTATGDPDLRERVLTNVHFLRF